jgi:hypothetical protein
MKAQARTGYQVSTRTGTPAGRAYAAALVSELEEQAGRAAWERLADRLGQVRYYRAACARTCR